MKIRTTTAMLVAAAMLQSVAVHAQVSTQELYNVKFKATCKPGDNGNNKSTKMKNEDLIQQVVGTGISSKDAKKNYAVVYNPASDSIQVVTKADGSLVGDVFIFDGGTNAVAGDQLSRFVFVFAPNQSDAIGSAVITERANNNSKKAKIEGKIQFTMPSDNSLSTGTTASIDSNTNTNSDSNSSTNSTGDTNNVSPNMSGSDTNGTGRDDTDTNGNDAFVQASAAAASTTAVDICSGTFSAGKLFVPGSNNNNNNNDNDTNTTGEVSGVPTNTPASTNILAADSVDARFLIQAAQADLFEIQLATSAAQNSTNQSVIDYANQLIQDHTQSIEQLQRLAADKGVTLPTTLTTANQNALNNLEKLSGNQFDRNFLTRAIDNHQSIIQLYNNEISRGDDADVKAFASTNLPTEQKHLTEAQQLRSQL